jgi:hypothetical protein
MINELEDKAIIAYKNYNLIRKFAIKTGGVLNDDYYIFPIITYKNDGIWMRVYESDDYKELFNRNFDSNDNRI